MKIKLIGVLALTSSLITGYAQAIDAASAARSDEQPKVIIVRSSNSNSATPPSAKPVTVVHAHPQAKSQAHPRKVPHKSHVKVKTAQNKTVKSKSAKSHKHKSSYHRKSN
jgi:hypothetical protein